MLPHKKSEKLKQRQKRSSHNRKFKCHARVTTMDEEIFSSLNEYNHTIDAAKVEATKLL